MFSRFSILARLTGHLEGSATDLDTLRTTLARSLENDLPLDQMLLARSFEAADKFSEEALDKQVSDRLGQLANNPGLGSLRNLRVFRREVPVRSSQIDVSNPLWGPGAATENVLGPYNSADGRRFWFDLYGNAGLVPVYVGTGAAIQPAMYLPLDMLELRRIARRNMGRGFEIPFTDGSVWINARFLDNSVPSNTAFIGVRVRSGKLVFSDRPTTMTDARLAIAPSHRMTIELSPFSPNPAGTGIPPQNAALTLPNSIRLVLNGDAISVADAAAANWRLFEQNIQFSFQQSARPVFSGELKRIIFPYSVSDNQLSPNGQQGLLYTLDGEASIDQSGWSFPIAHIASPDFVPPAAGAGAMAVRVGPGISASWPGLDNGPVELNSPWFILERGQMEIFDADAEGPAAAQTFQLWPLREGEEIRTSLELNFSNRFTFHIVASPSHEILHTYAHLRAEIDRPVTTTGVPAEIRSKKMRMLVFNLRNSPSSSNFPNFPNPRNQRHVYLEDDKLLLDLYEGATFKTPSGHTSFALPNALLRTTPASGFACYGWLQDDRLMASPDLFVTFGILGILPILPDPYAARLRRWTSMFFPFQGMPLEPRIIASITAIFTAHLSSNSLDGQAELSFFLGLLHPEYFINKVSLPFPVPPLSQHPWLDSWRKICPDISPGQSRVGETVLNNFLDSLGLSQRPNNRDLSFFTLFDVSSQADQMGVALHCNPNLGNALLKLEGVVTTAVAGTAQQVDEQGFHLKIKDGNVAAKAQNIQTVLPPQISWEPLENRSDPDGSSRPPLGMLYADDDGGPARLGGLRQDLVPITPVLHTEHWVQAFENFPNEPSWAMFTLPFGMRAMAVLQKDSNSSRGRQVGFVQPEFPNNLKGARQVRLRGKKASSNDSFSFPGFALQLRNVRPHRDGALFSVLGESVTEIFNGRFFIFDGSGIKLRDIGVPLERIDLSGYGASTTSHWLNPNASIADVSQAKFDVFLGRTALEIIQVRSLIYPWGIIVLRTISMFRLANGKIIREDSGWQAESEGDFNFQYRIKRVDGTEQTRANPYTFHPGVVSKVTNVRNIKETTKISRFTTAWNKNAGDTWINDNAREETLTASKTLNIILQPVFFDGDFVVTNSENMASKGICGYVQLSPTGEPIPSGFLQQLIESQNGSIGGSVDGEISLAGTLQRMRLNQIDVNVALNNSGNPEFVLAARGSVLLPKEGSWTVARHQDGNGEVHLLEKGKSVPVIRRRSGSDQSLRIADPADLLRTTTESLHYAFLQDTGTQKMLFSRPSYVTGNENLRLHSVHFADALTLLNASSLFPNVTDAFPISLPSNTSLKIVEEGLQLAQTGRGNIPKVDLDLDSRTFYLINTANFKLYVEYEGDKLNYGLNPLLSNEDRWSADVGGVAIMVDIGPFEKAFSIKGKISAANGKTPLFLNPKLEFGPQLKPIVQLLQFLQKLEDGGVDAYREIFEEGLKIAFSNSTDSWAYKFSAKKDIPYLKFPAPDEIFYNPATAFKMEFGMSLGVEFDNVSNSSSLIPASSAYLQFSGNVYTMVLSVGLGTIYAVGGVGMRLTVRSDSGPSIGVELSYGAQIVVGLPVIFNVSLQFSFTLLFEISGDEIVLGAGMIFKGRAKILFGLISINIFIEAKGAVRVGVPVGDLLLDMFTGNLPAAANQVKEFFSDIPSVHAKAQMTFALNIKVCWIFRINFEKSWEEERRIC
jgi:hypothetical protein